MCSGQLLTQLCLLEGARATARKPTQCQTYVYMHNGAGHIEGCGEPQRGVLVDLGPLSYITVEDFLTLKRETPDLQSLFTRGPLRPRRLPL